MKHYHLVGVVVIGRNEGERLKRCLASVQHSIGQQVGPIVYVDSGSTDGSVDHAKSVGVEVVDLDMTQHFTMARGRNAGLRYLAEHYPKCDFVQFVDGDCEVVGGWIAAACTFLLANPKVISVCGNRSERYPEESLYNTLINMEWQGVEGEVNACGGDAMYRITPLITAKGFNESMIAGEEGELCLRLRAQRFVVHRLDVLMTLHDANMHHLTQWWLRATRCGHAYAHGYDLHRKNPEGYKKRQVVSSVVYGFLCPLVILVLLSILLTQSLPQLSALFFFTAILFFLSLYIRLIETCVKSRLILGNSQRHAWLYGAFVALGKFPEAQGIAKYYYNKIRGVTAKIIEYRAN